MTNLRNFFIENIERYSLQSLFSVKALRLEAEFKTNDSSLKGLYKSIQVSGALCEFLSDKILIHFTHIFQ